MQASVYNNKILAGTLAKTKEGYVFTYTDEYYNDGSKPAISLSLPKNQKEYHSIYMFPFFSGLLAEGLNKQIQCRTLKIDEQDDFTRLIKTATTETIGAITLKQV
jgi:HipA-like protein